MALDVASLESWVGKTETRTDQITAAPIVSLSAAFDRDEPEPRPGDALPPLWHWLYFLPRDRQSDLAPDGLARRGGFLPAVPLPRRMWAGDRFEFHRPLHVGETVTRTSKILDVRHKEGRSGPLVFVRVRHEIGDALVEEHEIAYRAQAKPGEVAPPAPPAPVHAQWERTINPDAVLLFRYSALTFNGHRIHYDRRYATEVEGYPGLVVHGPLIATLLADLLRRNLPGRAVAGLTFRAMSPLFDTAPFSVCGQPEDNGKTVRLWAGNATGGLAMDATAALA